MTTELYIGDPESPRESESEGVPESEGFPESEGVPESEGFPEIESDPGCYVASCFLMEDPDRVTVTRRQLDGLVGDIRRRLGPEVLPTLQIFLDKLEQGNRDLSNYITVCEEEAEKFNPIFESDRKSALDFQGMRLRYFPSNSAVYAARSLQSLVKPPPPTEYNGGLGFLPCRDGSQLWYAPFYSEKVEIQPTTFAARDGRKTTYDMQGGPPDDGEWYASPDGKWVLRHPAPIWPSNPESGSTNIQPSSEEGDNQDNGRTDISSELPNVSSATE